MKLLVLSELYIRGTRIGGAPNNNRPAGAYYITQLARENGIDATNIDYFMSWPREVLIESILKWFDNEKECHIGFSGSIDVSGLDSYKEIVLELKKHLPQLKVMLGGFREPGGDSSWVDILLVGRCANIFLDYLQGKDISQYKVYDNPPGYKNPHGVITDKPVTPVISKNDFWCDQEPLTLELSLGCKFNCSFCGYDYRNNKNPQIAKLEDVVEALQTAYDVAGITRFFLADDTINEVDDKLKLLCEAQKHVSFTPEFMSFVRLDIMGAKPHQIDLMKECNLTSHFYGIESLTPDVTKLIRKGGKPEKNYEILRRVKNEFPEAFTFGNLIVGLAGDSEKNVVESCKKLVDEQLLTSGGCNALRIYSNITNDEIKSEIDKDPAKYGYNIIATDTIDWDNIGYGSDAWETDWTDSFKVEKLSNAIDEYLGENLESVFTAHEMFSFSTLVPGYSISEYNSMLPMFRKEHKRMVKNYIKKKSQFLLGDK